MERTNFALHLEFGPVLLHRIPTAAPPNFISPSALCTPLLNEEAETTKNCASIVSRMKTARHTRSYSEFMTRSNPRIDARQTLASILIRGKATNDFCPDVDFLSLPEDIFSLDLSQ